ncbi:hypothetical protein PX554_22125 [Sphingomonas sp. H39-1-10]|uniref:hypothetical protein n=1 Tax=Sphingomonas pollutisoli TaxID=3030829 RepID=UPI0023BA202A|nr:hypothetical protein [Sphingomonas pollutisoli]MDF0490835.1 hypothetical protein [Sphingomonas pollutisoli]
MRFFSALLSVSAMIGSTSSASYAAESVTYDYDALGRLIKVTHSGTVNSNTQIIYTLDNADNRTNVTITGANNRVVVVPLNGLTVIPIPDP